jgi:hypothetical protein
VDGVTESFDKVRNLSFVYVTGLDGVSNGVMAIIHVLDWSWVAIVINISPSSLSSLEFLVRCIIHVYLLGWNN